MGAAIEVTDLAIGLLTPRTRASWSTRAAPAASEQRQVPEYGPAFRQCPPVAAGASPRGTPARPQSRGASPCRALCL